MEQNKTEIATLGNGCFWCTEAIFSKLKGVIKTQSGYSGGTMEDPDYETVCSGSTGHAEVNQITFNPDVLSYHDLLEVFWNTHDPTTLNRQGNDIGTQYRSVIFYHSEAQKQTAEAYKKQLGDSKIFDAPIVTAIEPFTKIYPAEDYHTDYFNRNPGNTYCQFVVRPKVEKFEKKYAGKLK
jgi:peptide-methionine (S)-S-oxide reductase